MFAGIAGLGPDVVTVAQHYYQAGDESLVSQNRQTTIIPVVMTGTLEEATDHVEQLLHVVREADHAEGYRVLVSGGASIAHESNELATEDLEKGERIGIPVALIILLALFGAVAASLIPLGLGVVSIIIALGIAALIGQAFELVFFVTLMITMIGLAVGIDYSLFIVSRFREELDRGLENRAAVERAGATAGSAVLFSGITVVIALCGMLIVPATFFQSLGIGAIVVVMVAMAATLTLLPAVLSLLGPRVNFLSLPYFGRRRPPGRGSQAARLLGIHDANRDQSPHREFPARGRAHGRRHSFLLRHQYGNQRGGHVPGRRGDPRGVLRPGGRIFPSGW